MAMLSRITRTGFKPIYRYESGMGFTDVIVYVNNRDDFVKGLRDASTSNVEEMEDILMTEQQAAEARTMEISSQYEVRDTKLVASHLAKNDFIFIPE